MGGSLAQGGGEGVQLRALNPQMLPHFASIEEVGLEV